MLAALSFGLVTLLGLGLLVCVPLWQPAGRASLQQGCGALAVLLGVGLLVDLTLLLVLGTLTLTVAVGSVAAIGGLALGAMALATHRRVFGLRPDASWLALVPVLYLVGLIGAQIFAEPLHNWDARSIWFFHAKILYYAGGLSEGAGWADVAFSHPDYPKLLPALGAQVAHGAGYWNEYLPKTALLFLLIPAATGFFALVRQPLSAVFLGAFLFLRPIPLLWNGQADGYLAIYCALAALAVGRFLESRSALDLALGVVCLGIACSLKNEGLYFALALGASLALVWGWRRARKPALPDSSARATRAGWLALVAVAPFLLWRVKARAWGLRSDLDLSTTYIAQAWERFTDGTSLPMIARAFFDEHALGPVLLLLALAGVAALALRARPSVGAVVPFLASTLYVAALFGAYLGTPHELSWHLETSIHRTPLPSLLCGAAAVFFLLEGVERPGSRGAP